MGPVKEEGGVGVGAEGEGGESGVHHSRQQPFLVFAIDLAFHRVCLARPRLPVAEDGAIEPLHAETQWVGGDARGRREGTRGVGKSITGLVSVI